MKNRMIFVLLAVIAMLSLTACGSTNSGSQSTPSVSAEPTPTPTVEKKASGPYTYTGSPKCRYSGSEPLTVYQYDIDTGSKTEVFSFNWEDAFDEMTARKDLTIVDFDYERIPCCYAAGQVFDSKMTKLAVGWYAQSDGSRRVGWVDKYGSLTDVSNVIHPSTSDFSSQLPDDTSPIFTSNDELMFIDNNAKKYVYVDIDSMKITKEEAKEDGNLAVVLAPDGSKVSLTCDNYINNNEAIGIEKGEEYSFIKKYPIGDSLNFVKLTGKTDFDLSRCAYHDGYIAFMGQQGNDRRLFMIKDGDGEQEVKQIATNLSVEKGEQLLCWK